jgi:hypothetical protein
VTRVAAALLLALGLGTVQAGADFPAVFERAVAYVARFEKEFAAIIWRETYDQVDRLPRKFGTSGARFVQGTRRRLESEMLFIPAEANGTWLTVRDVISVDGKPVRRRLPALLESKNVRIRDLRTLSEENARYNIGPILRNFNEPTFTLLLLGSRYRSRFRFSDGGVAEVDGRSLRRIQFTEVVTPTVIRTEDGDVRSNGSLFAEPVTGIVRRTELSLNLAKNGTRADIDVSYAMDDRLGLIVPVEMHESYGVATSRPDERIDCVAKYTDFRRFEASGRVIIR